MEPPPGQLAWVRKWVGGLMGEMRRQGPLQHWLDSIPAPLETASPDRSVDDSADTISLGDSSPAPARILRKDVSFQSNDDVDLDNTNDENAEKQDDGVLSDILKNKMKEKPKKGTLMRERSTNSEGNSPRRRHPLFRDSSLQSEGATSRCSSVESLLESRRVDAEAVLRGVGFGPSPARQQLARIPDRFLRPSNVKGIDTDQFIKEEHRSMKMHECGVFGYRGLTGNPHIPPSTIVAKIIERISSCDELPDTMQISKSFPL